MFAEIETRLSWSHWCAECELVIGKSPRVVRTVIKLAPVAKKVSYSSSSPLRLCKGRVLVSRSVRWQYEFVHAETTYKKSCVLLYLLHVQKALHSTIQRKLNLINLISYWKLGALRNKQAYKLLIWEITFNINLTNKILSEDFCSITKYKAVIYDVNN